MPVLAPSDIRGIVFDLDGTLYVSDAFSATIQDVATAYIAGIKGISRSEADLLIAATRMRLREESGTLPTLSAVSAALGGNVRELHALFEEMLRPEAFLVRDERVIILLERLSRQFTLYIYTNNNCTLATRIISYLGLSGMFRDIFAIDDTWRAKPDEEMLTRILSKTGLSPVEVLFVGDRYDVDLRLPEKLGCPIYLSQSLEQLLRLEDLLKPLSRADKSADPADPPAVRP